MVEYQIQCTRIGTLQVMVNRVLNHINKTIGFYCSIFLKLNDEALHLSRLWSKQISFRSWTIIL